MSEFYGDESRESFQTQLTREQFNNNNQTSKTNFEGAFQTTKSTDSTESNKLISSVDNNDINSFINSSINNLMKKNMNDYATMRKNIG